MNRFVRPLAVAVAALVVAAPAAAGVSVTSVNTGGFPTVHATVVSSRGSAAAPRVTENGHPVAGLVSQNLGHAKAVVLAIDDSRSMIGAPLAAAVAAAQSFIKSKPRADAVAVLSFGPHPVSLSGLSTATIDTDTEPTTHPLTDYCFWVTPAYRRNPAGGAKLVDGWRVDVHTMAQVEKTDELIEPICEGRGATAIEALADALTQAARYVWDDDDEEEW